MSIARVLDVAAALGMSFALVAVPSATSSHEFDDDPFDDLFEGRP